MKSTLFIVPLVLLLFCGCRTVTIDEQSFVLATFNIRCPVDKSPNSWLERKSRCTALIKKNGFDIFGVQEATREQLNDLLACGTYQYIGGGRNDFKDSGEFSAILYRKDRFKLIKGGTFGLSETPEIPGVKSWGSACPRIATWGLFQDRQTGKKFIYYNTHLDHVSEQARVNGIKLLVAHARKNMPGLPLVLSGDFNAKPGSPTYQTAAAMLKDSAYISHVSHSGPKGTFHNFGKVRRDYPIDFIFVSESFEVLSHRTDDTKFSGGYPSDHYPVITKLYLK